LVCSVVVRLTSKGGTEESEETTTINDVFAGYFSYANTLLSKLIKAHLNQNDGKFQAFLQ
jgi:hypothetical protein